MKVLITGGTGYIGGAVLEALAAEGHDPLGVAHSPAVADGVRARGGTPVPGDLHDAEGLAALASRAEAVIHAANTNGADAAAADIAATRALLGALAGTGKPFVYTSGAWVLGEAGARAADELAPLDPTPLIAWRAGLEAEILAAPGVHGIVLRPAIVFGEAGGIPAQVVNGDIPLIGDGAQRWPLVHVRDLAELYVRALHAPARSVLHGVSTTATMRDLWLLGRTRHPHGASPRLALHEARQQLGAFADALALDQVVSAARTRALTGWSPRRRSVVEEFLGGDVAGGEAAA